MRAVGVYEDGWACARSVFTLPAGGPARLTLRADVLACPDQHLSVDVDGARLAAREVEAGPLEFRVPLPGASAPRRVELHWQRTTQPSTEDTREVAALIHHLGLEPLGAPTAVAIPAGLGTRGVEVRGIDPDGWARRECRITLAGGPATDVVVIGDVALERQKLVVRVDGDIVLEDDLVRGAFNVRARIRPSDGDRAVELTFADAPPLSVADPRAGAARLTFVGVVSGDPPTLLTAEPGALASPLARHGGIHGDGWLAQSAWVEVQQRRPSTLVVDAHVLPLAGQQLEILLDDQCIHDAPAPAGRISVRVPVPLATRPVNRRVDIRWAAAAAPGPGDERRVAALLRHVGFVDGRAPAVVRPGMFADPNLVSTGVYDDGWCERFATLTLAGGPAADLTLAARMPTPHEQAVELHVDGVHVGGSSSESGGIDLRVPVPPTTSDRHIELRWQRAQTLSPHDQRTVAAQLLQVALEAPRRGSRRLT